MTPSPQDLCHPHHRTFARMDSARRCRPAGALSRDQAMWLFNAFETLPTVIGAPRSFPPSLAGVEAVQHPGPPRLLPRADQAINPLFSPLPQSKLTSCRRSRCAVLPGDSPPGCGNNLPHQHHLDQLEAGLRVPTWLIGAVHIGINVFPPPPGRRRVQRFRILRLYPDMDRPLLTGVSDSEACLEVVEDDAGQSRAGRVHPQQEHPGRESPGSTAHRDLQAARCELRVAEGRDPGVLWPGRRGKDRGGPGVLYGLDPCKGTNPLRGAPITVGNVEALKTVITLIPEERRQDGIFGSCHPGEHPDDADGKGPAERGHRPRP